MSGEDNGFHGSLHGVVKSADSTAYVRTPEQRQHDFAAAHQFEEIVGSHLPEYKISRLSAPDDLDFWVPGYYVEVKEKRQPLSPRWHLLPGVDEQDHFVMDELSVRRALRHWPIAYILVRDLPTSRLFIGSITEWACVERARGNRAGKGKWLVNLTSFRRLARLEDMVSFIHADMASEPWNQSAVLSPVLPVREI